MKHLESYIDDSIEDPKNLPLNVMSILDDLRQYDKEGKSVLYFDRLDDLWVITKEAMAANVMSQNAWDIVVKKYWAHADNVFEMENASENGNL